MPTPFDLTRDEGIAPAAAQRRSIFANFRSEAAEAPPPRPTAPAFASAPGNASPPSSDRTPARDGALARSFVYRYVAKAFEIPDRVGWRWLVDPDTGCALEAATGEGLARGAQELVAALRRDPFEIFETDYYAAFGHTVRGECPMNEIEYGDIKADPLFQPHRLADLGAFYRAFGLEVVDDAGERLDHICLELEFMSVLAAKEAFALERNLSGEERAVCRDAQKKFLREHLGRWTPAFTRRLATTAPEGALRCLAQLTREWIVADCAAFGVAPGSEDLLLRPVDESAETLCASCGLAELPPGAGVPAAAGESSP